MMGQKEAKDKKEINFLVNKKIYVILKTGRVYSGLVDSVIEGIVCITDKYDKKVFFSMSEVSSLQEER